MKGDSLEVSDDTPMCNPQGLPLNMIFATKIVRKTPKITNPIFASGKKCYLKFECKAL